MVFNKYYEINNEDEKERVKGEFIDSIYFKHLGLEIDHLCIHKVRLSRGIKVLIAK